MPLVSALLQRAFFLHALLTNEILDNFTVIPQYDHIYVQPVRIGKDYGLKMGIGIKQGIPKGIGKRISRIRGIGEYQRKSQVLRQSQRCKARDLRGMLINICVTVEHKPGAKTI